MSNTATFTYNSKIDYKYDEDDILGLNVLEYFNYLIDSQNDMIYFADNPSYKPPTELGCGRLFSIKHD